jgi:hypothetical protein
VGDERYRAAIRSWIVAGLGPPAIATAAVTLWSRAACGSGGGECSWGFEYLLVLPVLLVAFFGWGPRQVARGTDDAPRMRRWARVAAGAALVIFYLTAGGGGVQPFLVAVALSAVAVPVAAVWLTDRRGRRSTGDA